jgi:hypothetical protein
MFHTIYRARTQSEADVVIALLRASGLHPIDLDTSSHFSHTGLDITYHVDVPEHESETAVTLLASAEGSPPDQS